MGCLNTHPVRQIIPEVLGRKDFCHITEDFFGFLPEEDKVVLRQKWIDVLKNSKYILCPRGAGLNTFRFFETLAFGRIPVLVSDDTKLPLEDKINYNRFVVRVPENDLNNLDKYLDNFDQQYNFVEASYIADQIWSTCFMNIVKFLPAHFSGRIKLL
jgi:hypothetical protein